MAEMCPEIPPDKENAGTDIRRRMLNFSGNQTKDMNIGFG